MHRKSRPRLAAVVLAVVSGAGLAGVWGGGSASAQVPGGENYDGWKVVRVVNKSLRDLRMMEGLGAQPWRCGGVGVGPSEYMVSPEAMAALKAAGVKSEVVVPDLRPLIERERAEIAAAREAEAAGGLRGPGWFSTYRTYTEISSYVNTLVAAHPELAVRVNVGNSLQVRQIFGIRITSSANGGPGVKPQIVLNGLQHAREWITGATTMWIADKLVNTYTTDTRVQRLLDRYEFIIIPVTNPDGYEWTWSNVRLWRKNRRDNGNGTVGVDTNRNWGYQWGGEGASTDPSNDTYRGTAAFSEPETQAMRDFILAQGGRVAVAVDVHSYSQLILSPWSYTAALPPDSALFDTLNAGFVSSVESTHGMDYTGGPTYTTIYPASGAAGDWTYGGAGALGWGMELRDTGTNGFTLPADQIVPTAEETWAGIAWVADWLLDNPAVFISFPQGQPTSLAAAATTSVQFAVQRALGRPVAGTEKFYYRVGRSAAFVQAGTVSLGGGVFSASISAGPCNSVVQFYVEAQSSTGATVRYPAGGAAAPIEVPALASSTVLSDTFDAAGAWTVGGAGTGDNATSGVWARGVPLGTAAQPAGGHNGGNCYFTGQGTSGGAVGEADVDGGQTTLTSPTLNLTGGTDARISYWRWYSNNAGSAPGADTFVVDVSNNGGSTWTRAETVGPTGAGTTGGWVQASWLLSSLTPPVSPSANVQVRFIASDVGSGSIIEAAIDDFAATTTGCPLPPCPGDWNRDGQVTPSDVAEYINAWVTDLANGTIVSDRDGNGIINPADVAAFVNGWSASLAGGCGG